MATIGRKDKGATNITRRDVLDSIRKQPEISVLIVGGGINGIGLLRELALQGVDALLVEKSDFCAGTSAASTRIIHGGLRYLENGEFRLVRESLKERNLLLGNAPHYVKPLPTTIPIFNWRGGIVEAAKQFVGLRSKFTDRGALLIKAGLTMYDTFAGRQRVMPRHRFASRGASLAYRPQLNPAIVCTATYYDASITYPERLCLEVALDAERISANARALNYVCLESAEGDTVILKDEVSDETVRVKPKILVNATGAWIDFTNRAMERETQFIGGTKGSHVVIDHAGLFEATRDGMMYFANADGRVCIFYRYYDKIIAGSTDIPVDDPETALCTDDEVNYILDSVRYVFPAITLDQSHVVFRFSGVRPLPRSNAATPGQISRDHHCAVIPAGDGLDFPIYSLIGGKWTTFRAFSEQVADQLLPVLGCARTAESDHLAIGGGKDYPAAKEAWLERVAGETGVPTARLATLLDRYGTRAEAVAAFIAGGEDTPLKQQPEYSRREILFLATYERVVHLDDVILRRTLMGLLGQVNRGLVDELTAILAPALGWSDADVQAEVARTAGILETRHGVKIDREKI
jgi:glycerol-3-phosphate dehydrogenase